MHELSGRILPPMTYYGMGKPVLTFEVDSNTETLFQIFEELKATERLTIKISKYQKKRSLDANAYAWVLISRLAEKLNIPKTDIYRSAIKEIGGNSDTVCIQDKAVQSLRDGWERNGIGWLTETMKSKIDGCTNVVLYYGSSTYDSSQMYRLISLIQEDCRLQGIEVKSKEEVASLLGAWSK
jgi:hypothetical protein